jgi:hypothetical protein
MAKVKIGNREFEVDKFNINDIMVIDEKVGDITKLGSEEKIREKLKNIRYVLWYALQKKDKNITEEGVGKLINVSETSKITEDFFKAVEIIENPTQTPKVIKK